MTKSKFYRQSDCKLCGLHETRNKVVISDGGIEPYPVVVIGEAPGADEDATGTPFVGRSGGLLRSNLLAHAGLDPGVNCAILNTVSCRPPNNRNPTKEEAAACEDWLAMNLAIIQPKIVLLVGKVAAGVFLKGNPPVGFVYSGTDLRKRWRKDQFNFKAFAIYHPAYILRNNTIENKAAWIRTISGFRKYAVKKDIL